MPAPFIGRMSLSTRQRRSIIAVAVASAVLLALIVPTVSAGWAPILHFECGQGAKIVQELVWVPAVLGNSPYGGRMFDNGTIPPDIPGAPGYPNAWSALGAPAWNGSAAGAFFLVNVSVFRSSNSTVLGPGPNARCNVPFVVQYLSLGEVDRGTVFVNPIGLPSNLSDRGEVTEVAYPHPSFAFNNSFRAANSPSISTCGQPARSVNVSSPHFTAMSPGTTADAGAFLPVLLPFGGTFHYWFPGNFGTWQVDNLSAPGGPGGGWAFSYSPCP